MTDGPVVVETSNGVARIILSRPSSGNAIDLRMSEEINRAAAACDTDAAVRCVVLTGEGSLFCGGGDVKSFYTAGVEASAMIKAITGNLHMAIGRLLRMEKPLITVVNGPAGGAGFSLACLGDIVLVSRSAHFTAGYTAIGLAPDGGLSWTLPRLIGLRRAQDLILTNRRLGATEAVELGVATRCVEPDQLRAEEDALTRTLATGPTLAYGLTRQLLLSSSTTPLETQLELESRAISQLAASKNGREGVAAFVEKRPPVFD